MIASQPWSRAAARIRSSSVAIQTAAAPLARARSATRTTIGLPAMSASAFPGSLLDAYRAGMRTVKLSSPSMGSR